MEKKGDRGYSKRKAGKQIGIKKKNVESKDEDEERKGVILRDGEI